MLSRPTGFLQRLRFGAASLAMLVAVWAAVDMHTHQDGLHAPISCSVCAIEKATGGGFAPAAAFSVDTAVPSFDLQLPEKRLQALAWRRFTSIRAPPCLSSLTTS